MIPNKKSTKLELNLRPKVQKRYKCFQSEAVNSVNSHVCDMKGFFFKKNGKNDRMICVRVNRRIVLYCNRLPSNPQTFFGVVSFSLFLYLRFSSFLFSFNLFNLFVLILLFVFKRAEYWWSLQLILFSFLLKQANRKCNKYFCIGLNNTFFPTTNCNSLKILENGCLHENFLAIVYDWGKMIIKIYI